MRLFCPSRSVITIFRRRPSQQCALRITAMIRARLRDYRQSKHISMLHLHLLRSPRSRHSLIRFHSLSISRCWLLLLHHHHHHYDDPTEDWELTLFYCIKGNMSTGRSLFQAHMSIVFARHQPRHHINGQALHSVQLPRRTEIQLALGSPPSLSGAFQLLNRTWNHEHTVIF